MENNKNTKNSKSICNNCGKRDRYEKKSTKDMTLYLCEGCGFKEIKLSEKLAEEAIKHGILIPQILRGSWWQTAKNRKD